MNDLRKLAFHEVTEIENVRSSFSLADGDLHRRSVADEADIPGYIIPKKGRHMVATPRLPLRNPDLQEHN